MEFERRPQPLITDCVELYYYYYLANSEPLNTTSRILQLLSRTVLYAFDFQFRSNIRNLVVQRFQFMCSVLWAVLCAVVDIDPFPVHYLLYTAYLMRLQRTNFVNPGYERIGDQVIKVIVVNGKVPGMAFLFQSTV